VKAEIVAVGSELLLGQIVDTNSATIARYLASLGIDLFYITAVGDNLGRLTETLRQAVHRSDLVLTTGGIGPTPDDVTREAVAAATGRELVFSEDLMRQIEAFFASRGMRPSPSNHRQAYLPAGALPVDNPVGTAPGFILPLPHSTVITLPGVPREMEHLLVTRVVPYLRQRQDTRAVVRLRVLKCVGLGESSIGERLADFMERGANPTVGTLAHLGQVDVRIAAKAPDAEAADRLIAPVEAEIRRRLRDHVFGADETTLESVVADQLRSAGARLAMVELGGAGAAIGRMATAAPEVLASGLVLGSPADAAAVGVALPTGAVIEERARVLAEGGARWARAQVGAALLVEPSDGPTAVRVGIGVATARAGEGRAYGMGGDLASVRIRAGTLLLDLLRRTLAREAW
jgi:nicotinamide-nucleotide amidase